MEESEEKKITEYDFVVRAIKKLRKPPYKGIHSVYSGFNQAFREYFDKDPVKVTTKLTQEGKLVTRPVRGGVTLYLPEDAPASARSKSVLDKIVGEDDSGKESITHEGGNSEESDGEDELIILGPEEEKK